MKDKDAKLIWESVAENFEFGGHRGEQRRDSAEKQTYVVADSEGVYGVYSSMAGAAEARADVGGGSYVVAVSVDTGPQQYDSVDDSDLYPDEQQGGPEMPEVHRNHEEPNIDPYDHN